VAPDETDRFPELGVEGVAPGGEDFGGAGRGSRGDSMAEGQGSHGGTPAATPKARGEDSEALDRGRLALERLLGGDPPAPFGGGRPPAAGDEVGGVVLEAVLGRGGMGVVWRGRDPRLGRDVAVKLLGRATDQDGLARFRLEVETTARLRHPNVVGVHAAGELRGWPWLVMDLVEGESLARRLEREPGRRLAPRPAVELAHALADALAHAHAQGVVHRDVKPGNVLLDASDPGGPRPRLVDFGLARDLHRDARLTPSGVVVGTPAYMAPEQLVGGPVDGRTDVWGLGATLHELLTGQPPFAGHTGAALLGALRRRPTPPSDHAPLVDAGLDRMVRACLEPDPADRYPSAAALRDDLGRWLAGERVRPPGRARRRERRPILAAAALALSVVAGLALLPALRRDGDQPAPPAGTTTRPLAPLASRPPTELERLILEAPRRDPDALRRLGSPPTDAPEPVQLLAGLLLGAPGPRTRVEAALGAELPAAARDLEPLEERVLTLEGWSARGLDASGDVRAWWRLVRRLEALPDSPAGRLVRRRAQRLLGRAVPALYLQLGRSVLGEPLLPLVRAIEALGADAGYLLPARAWLLFMDMATRDAPTELRALLAPEHLPPDLPRWQGTLVEVMRIAVRRSGLSAAAAAEVHDDLVDYAWRDASLVVIWVQREVGRLYREEALARHAENGRATAPASIDVRGLRELMKEAVDWGSRACASDATGMEGAELAITLLSTTDWSAARDLTAGLLIDPALCAALQAEVDLAAVSAEEALAWIEANIDTGRTPAARATLRLARAHARAELGQAYEEDLAVAAALLGPAAPALDIPWLRDVKKTRELCQGHAWWPGDLRHR